MDSDDEYYAKKLKTKGKTKTFLPKTDFLELMPRGRQGKCVGAASEIDHFNQNKPHTDAAQPTPSHTFISNDIWFHLAKYISPENVKNYSLICSQSANSVNSRSFWLQMYHSYCQQSSGTSRKWVLDLPEDLQLEHLKDCGRNTLRQKVIQALYQCYPVFKKRLNTPYTLESLVGRVYVSSW